MGHFKSWKFVVLSGTVKSGQIWDFSGPNTGKYGPEKTPYLNTSRSANPRTVIELSLYNFRFY